MELKENIVGTTFYTKKMGAVTIENDKAKFKLYKNLGLDVFKPKKEKKVKKEEE